MTDLPFDFPASWEIEICDRCGSVTEYDRDYGGPFPTDNCPFADCDVNVDNEYGSCPYTRTIVVVQSVSKIQTDGAS